MFRLTSCLAVLVVLVGVGRLSAGTLGLIVNGDFELGNTGFTSEYTHNPGDISPRGTYDLVSDPTDAHPSLANPSYGDHTTGSGLMLAANACGDCGDLAVWSQEVEVTLETSYKFSAWVSNWAAGGKSPPQMDFFFNGVSVGLFNDVTTPAIWMEFGATWDSTDNTLVTIEIFDRNTVVSGNDFALDDISMNPIPEPSTLALLCVGAVGLLAYGWRRRQRTV